MDFVSKIILDRSNVMTFIKEVYEIFIVIFIFDVKLKVIGLSRNLDQNMPKMHYFFIFEKGYKNRRIVRGSAPELLL